MATRLLGFAALSANLRIQPVADGGEQEERADPGEVVVECLHDGREAGGERAQRDHIGQREQAAAAVGRGESVIHLVWKNPKVPVIVTVRYT